MIAAAIGWIGPQVVVTYIYGTGSDTEIQGRERSVYYRNCDAARAAGAAPIYRGQPGYRVGLDRDSDGVACEPFRPR